jgi:hypothetical protein
MLKSNVGQGNMCAALAGGPNAAGIDRFPSIAGERFEVEALVRLVFD